MAASVSRRGAGSAARMRPAPAAAALIAAFAVAAVAPALAGDALAEAAYEPPLKQHERVLAQAVVCNAGLELVLKSSNGSPACVSPGAKAVLLERGWAREPPVVQRIPSIDLTDDERAWLADNQIRASYDPYWPPFEFTNDDGEMDGLSAAYREEFERLVGADIAVVPSPDWPGALQAVRDGRVDVLFMTGDTPDRREFMGFTPAHMNLPTAMITLGGDVAAGELDGKKVGTIRGYEVEAWLDENRPDIDYVPFDEGLAFTALQAGDIDVLLWFWEIADYKAQLAGVQGLYNAGELGHSMDVSVAYALGDPVLASIVEKAMAAISDVDIDRMLNEAILDRPSREMVAASAVAIAAPDDGPALDLPSLDFTAAERAWLGSGPTIKVAYDPGWPPVEFDLDGEVAGLSAAYMEAVRTITGAEFKSVPKDTWVESLAAVRSGEADVIFSLARTDDREVYMGFTEPHTTLPWHIVTLSARAVEAEDLGTLKVGTIEGYSVEAWLDGNMPSVRYASYPDYAQLLGDLQTGEIEAFIEMWPVAKMQGDMAGLQVYRAGKLGASLELSAGYSKSNSILGSIMAKAIDAVPDDFKESAKADLVPPPAKSSLALTVAEAAWVADNPVIQVAYDPDFAPFEFLDKSTGELGGPARAYMDRFSELMGVQFELIQASTWGDSLEAMRTGDADVMFMVARTEDRKEFMGFTEPHTVLTWDMITAGEQTTIAPADLGDLKVGAISDYAVSSWIAENLPEVRVTPFDRHAAALAALKSGDIDVFVDTWATSLYAAQGQGIDDLNNAGPLDTTLDLAIAYSKNNSPVLGSILAKALAEVPPSERERLASVTTAASVAGAEAEAEADTEIEADPGSPNATQPAPLLLTDEEAEWVGSNPVVRLAYDPDWPPLEYAGEDGSVEGLTRAYVERFSALTGLQFEPIAAETWSDSLEAMRTGDADAMFMVARTAEREEFMGFTEPHTALTWDMITAGEEAATIAPADLGEQMVGTISDYAVVSWIAENLPGVAVMEFDDHDAALGALAAGDIDVFVDTWATSLHAAQGQGIDDLNNAGPLGATLDLAIGYSKGSAELGSILAKALADMPAAEREELVSMATAASPAATPAPAAEAAAATMTATPMP